MDLVEEKHSETIKRNSRDRLKPKATVEKEVITFTIPTNLVALPRNGKNEHLKRCWMKVLVLQLLLFCKFVLIVEYLTRI